MSVVNSFATAAIVGTLTFGVGGVASAQQTDVGGSQGLVVVDISNVRVDIADVLDVEENQIPVTVQVPVGVAANVCPNVDANVLAQDFRGSQDTACQAQSTSQALNKAVQRQIRG